MEGEQAVVNPMVKVFNIDDQCLEDNINEFLGSDVALMETHNFGSKIVMFYFPMEQVAERVLSVVPFPKQPKN